MPFVKCCGVPQKAEIFRIVPTQQNSVEEYIMKVESCLKCEKPVVEIARVMLDGKIQKNIRIKTTNIKTFLDSVSVIYRCKVLTHRKKRQTGFRLGFNEWGKKKLCAQNLSSIRLGIVDTDVMKGLKYFYCEK